MSKKPKTPDVAAVWHEVKGISNGLEALRVTVAVTGNDVKASMKEAKHVDARVDRVWDEIERFKQYFGMNGFEAPKDFAIFPRLDKLEASAKLLGDAFDRIKALENAEIDAQAIGEQIGELEVRIETRVDEYNRLCEWINSLELKMKAADQPRSQSERMLDQARTNYTDSVFNYAKTIDRRIDSVQSVVVVLVIVQAFTVIAGLAWVIGGGW